MQTSSASFSGFQLLIDENLADNALAKALSAVGYKADAVRERFGPGTEDPLLIEWLGMQNGIWVTRDKKAKSKHAQEIENSQIHIVWMAFPKKLGLSMKDQLLLLLWHLDSILEQVSNAKRTTRFRLSFNGRRPRCDRLQ